jgi:hypothetical protein
MEFLTSLSTQVKQMQTTDAFFVYLKEAQIEADTLAGRLIKGYEFMKLNNEDMDESMY